MNPIELLQLGFEQGEKENYDQAIKTFSQVIQLVPDLPIAYIGRGMAYRKKRDYIRAISDHEAAAKLAPEYLETLEAVKKEYEEWERGKPEREREECERVERERKERERMEQKRQEREQQELERKEREQQEQERKEREHQEWLASEEGQKWQAEEKIKIEKEKERLIIQKKREKSKKILCIFGRIIAILLLVNSIVMLIIGDSYSQDPSAVGDIVGNSILALIIFLIPIIIIMLSSNWIVKIIFLIGCIALNIFLFNSMYDYDLNIDEIFFGNLSRICHIISFIFAFISSKRDI